MEAGGKVNLAVIMITWVCIQSNLDSSNTDGSFTMANSNSFLSPCEILKIALKNKYLGEFSYYHKIVCCVLIRIA